jgi:hypothetical protein
MRQNNLVGSVGWLAKASWGCYRMTIDQVGVSLQYLITSKLVKRGFGATKWYQSSSFKTGVVFDKKNMCLDEIYNL